MLYELKWHSNGVDYNPHIVQDNLLIIFYDSIILDLRSVYEDMHKYVFLRIGLGTYFQYEKTQSTAVYHVIYCCVYVSM